MSSLRTNGHTRGGNSWPNGQTDVGRGKLHQCPFFTITRQWELTGGSCLKTLDTGHILPQNPLAYTKSLPPYSPYSPPESLPRSLPSLIILPPPLPASPSPSSRDCRSSPPARCRLRRSSPVTFQNLNKVQILKNMVSLKLFNAFCWHSNFLGFSLKCLSNFEIPKKLINKRKLNSNLISIDEI